MTLNQSGQLKSQLDSIGVFVTSTWIEHMLDKGISELNQLILVYLNSDLYSQMSPDSALPRYEDMEEVHIQRPLVLQIEEIINIGVSMEQRNSDQNATFKIFLTDGHRSVVGLLVDRIPGMSWNTVTGSKVLVLEGYIRRNVLLLHSRNCKYLGGREIMRRDDWSSDSMAEEKQPSEIRAEYGICDM